MNACSAEKYHRNAARCNLWLTALAIHTWTYKWHRSSKVPIVMYTTDIKLGSLIIIQSLNSLCLEVPDDLLEQ